MVLRSRVEIPDWSAGGNPEKEAKCRKHPLPSRERGLVEDAFFPEDNDAEATHICNGDYDDRVCPFRETCRYIALINNAQEGVWGGLMPEQRRWIRRHIPKEFWDCPGLLHAVPPIEEFQPEESDAKEDSVQPTEAQV